MRYRKNHHIPVCMLNYWASESKTHPYKGVWIYDITSKRKYFANAQGRNAYNFAVSDDLYIPIIDGKRITTVERWLSSLEGTLSDFTSQIHNRTRPLSATNYEGIVKFLMALFALECRSPDIIDIYRGKILDNSEIKLDEAEIHKLALENIINYVHENSLRFCSGTMVIMCYDNRDVLIGDRPVLNGATLPAQFFAVTSTSLVALSDERQGNSGLSYAYVECEQGILDIVNRHIALQARKWIGATTEEQLDQYIDVFSSDEWLNYYKTKKISSRLIPESWRIDSEER